MSRRQDWGEERKRRGCQDSPSLGWCRAACGKVSKRLSGMASCFGQGSQWRTLDLPHLFLTIQWLKWHKMFGFRETSPTKQWVRKLKFLKCSSVIHITGIMEEHIWEDLKCLGSVCFLISDQTGISRLPCHRIIFKMGLHTWRFLSIYLKFKQKGLLSHGVLCWVAQDWDVCTSSKTASDIIAAQFVAQVEKALQLQGQGSCQQRGFGCKVFTGSALKWEWLGKCSSTIRKWDFCYVFRRQEKIRA